MGHGGDDWKNTGAESVGHRGGEGGGVGGGGGGGGGRGRRRRRGNDK